MTPKNSKNEAVIQWLANSLKGAEAHDYVSSIQSDTKYSDESVPIDFFDDGEDAYLQLVDQIGSGIANFTPDIRLRIAAIGDAIWCIQKKPRVRNGRPDRNAKLDQNIAIDWVNGKHKSLPTFSFIEVCEIVGLNPNATRVAIAKLVKSRKFDVRELSFWLTSNG